MLRTCDQKWYIHLCHIYIKILSYICIRECIYVTHIYFFILYIMHSSINSTFYMYILYALVCIYLNAILGEGKVIMYSNMELDGPSG